VTGRSARALAPAVRPGATERALLSRAVVLTALVAAVAAPVALVVRGPDGLAGAALGAALVLGFLLIGQVPVAQVARGRRRLGAALLIGLYTARVLLLLVAYRVVTASPAALDRQVLGGTVVACALAWTGGTVWSMLRWRPLVIDADPGQEDT